MEMIYRLAIQGAYIATNVQAHLYVVKRKNQMGIRLCPS